MALINTAAIREDLERNQYAEPEDTAALCDALDAARHLDYVVTAYMLGDVDGAAVAKAQHAFLESWCR